RVFNDYLIDYADRGAGPVYRFPPSLFVFSRRTLAGDVLVNLMFFRTLALILLHEDIVCVFFFSSRRRHTSSKRDWSSDVCSSDLSSQIVGAAREILEVEDALGETSEEPRHAVLEHGATRAQQRRLGVERAAERHQV